MQLRHLPALVASLLLLLATPRSLRADPAPPSDEDRAYGRHMDLGIRLYEDRSFDAAMIEFERAYELRNGAGPLINIALCHKGRLEYVKAASVLQLALSKHGSAPDQVARMEQALAEIRELLAEIELKIAAEATNVRVEIDGEVLPPGAHQAPIEVSPGSHTLVVRADGHAAFRQELKLGAGDRRAMAIALVADAGTLVVETGHLGARISVNGETQTSTGVRKLLKGGTHLVTLERDGDRYTASVAVVPARETRVTLDDQGLLRVADSPPRGPDEVQLPPRSGFYLLAGASVGGRSTERDVAAISGPDVRLGYRINRNIGLEAYVRQLFTSDVRAPDSITQVGSGIRMMTSNEPVYFAAAAGLGYSHEAPLLGDAGFPAFHVFAEPQIAGEVGNVVLAFGTPLTFSAGAYPPNIELSGRLQAGYGVW